jgi:hypothetical protein
MPSFKIDYVGFGTRRVHISDIHISESSHRAIERVGDLI